MTKRGFERPGRASGSGGPKARGWRPHWLGLAVLIALGTLQIAATDGGSEPSEEASPTPSPSGVLDRREVPPGGVEFFFDQFGVFAYAGCRTLGIGLDPGTVTEGPRFEIGERFPVCVGDGFGRRDIVVAVREPDGATRTIDVPYRPDLGGYAPFDLAALPGMPLGTYDVTVLGDATGRSEYRVTRATEPRWTIVPRQGQPGTRFQIGIAGLPPSRTSDAYLYRSVGQSPGEFVGERWEYVTDLQVRTDPDGQAQIELATFAGEPLGRYRLSMPDVPGIGSPIFTLLCPASGCDQGGATYEGLLAELPAAVDPDTCQPWTSADERAARGPTALTAFDFGATAAVQCDTDDLPSVRQVALFTFVDAPALSSYWEHVMQLVDADPGPGTGWPERIRDCREGTPRIMATENGQLACWRVQPANTPAKIRWTEPDRRLYGVLDWRTKPITAAYAWWEENVLGS